MDPYLAVERQKHHEVPVAANRLDRSAGLSRLPEVR
jgi:hypothetical protein